MLDAYYPMIEKMVRREVYIELLLFSFGMKRRHRAALHAAALSIRENARHIDWAEVNRGMS